MGLLNYVWEFFFDSEEESKKFSRGVSKGLDEGGALQKVSQPINNVADSSRYVSDNIKESVKYASDSAKDIATIVSNILPDSLIIAKTMIFPLTAAVFLIGFTYYAGEYILTGKRGKEERKIIETQGEETRKTIKTQGEETRKTLELFFDKTYLIGMSFIFSVGIFLLLILIPKM
jgi:hypothetical protein